MLLATIKISRPHRLLASGDEATSHDSDRAGSLWWGLLSLVADCEVTATPILKEQPGYTSPLAPVVRGSLLLCACEHVDDVCFFLPALPSPPCAAAHVYHAATCTMLYLPRIVQSATPLSPYNTRSATSLVPM